jgi:HEAT repeat protein
VASALGEIGDPRAARRLGELLEDPAIQSTAIEALRRMGAGALPELERSFQGAEPAGRRALVSLAGKLEDERARRLLQQALLDDDAGVRAEAALALGDGGFVDSVRALMDLRGSDPAPAVRRAAARALAKLAPR